MPAGKSIFNSATIKHFENLQNFCVCFRQILFLHSRSFSRFVGGEVHIRKEKVWKNVLNRRDN